MSSSAHTAPISAPGDVVPLDAGHIPQALALSQALKWPYRAEDWAFALALGRGFAVELDGRLVGTALWWPYGDDYASAGMIIVASNAQRRGIGARLMDALLADAAGRTIILNSTLDGERLYQRLDFEPCGVVQQHQAVLEAAPTIDAGVSLRAARPDDRAALNALDRAASGMDRGALLDALFGVADVLVIERDGRLMGYGCVRRWGRGFVVGPVAARDVRDAKALIAALAARHVGDFVRIDVTEASGLGPWLGTVGLPQTDRVVAMSRGAPPQGDPDATLFALSNQSLG
ncbi:GNAT family N-acetyltransferase [Flavisphingomonas formosensis]|uniref:GNAT family N-acetyltransferase n=1 Tax=Flavisphingomonas formosensis TaxID=861534 RepID=UPI0012F7651E|nr:GNAT family N-acetyltransferase [Sphingomonas formosensis]